MCEKCRMMELFDEELARFETYDNDEAFSIARHRYALERRWKALEPGRKVLEIETFTVLTVKKAYSNGIDFYGDWTGCKHQTGPEWDTGKKIELIYYVGYDRLTDKRAYQILHEGPFDAWKLQPGDWFWISEPFKKWVRFNHSKPNGLISIIDGNIVYTCYPYKTSFHFSPPAPPSREERIEKALSNTTPYLSGDVSVPVAQDDCIERIISYVDEYINDQIDRVVLKSEIGQVLNDIFFSYLQKGG